MCRCRSRLARSLASSAWSGRGERNCSRHWPGCTATTVEPSPSATARAIFDRRPRRRRPPAFSCPGIARRRGGCWGGGAGGWRSCRGDARRADSRRDRRGRGGVHRRAGDEPRRHGGWNGRVRRLWEARELSTVAILVLEVAFFAWYLWPSAGRPHPFFNPGNAVLVLKYSSIYGIAAVGAAIVIISGGVDLAPGAVIALSGVVTGALFVEGHWSLGSSASAGILAGAVCGVVSAVLVVVAGLPPFIATLGVMGIARGAAFIITEGRYFDVSGALPPGWHLVGVPLDWTSPLLMVAFALVFQTLMTRFEWGRAVFAVGGNETAALYAA